MSNCQMYLSKKSNVFVQIAKCICPNSQMYFSTENNIFGQIVKCICPTTLTGRFVSHLEKNYFHGVEMIISRCLQLGSSIVIPKKCEAIPTHLPKITINWVKFWIFVSNFTISKISKMLSPVLRCVKETVTSCSLPPMSCPPPDQNQSFLFTIAK